MSVKFYFDNLAKLTMKEPKNSFVVKRANRLSATVLSVLCDMTLCHEILIELNNSIAKNFSTALKSVTPNKYEMVHAINLPVPNELEINLDLIQCLDEVLLAFEKAHGINNKCALPKSPVPVFIGQIPNDEADNILLNNYLWNDTSIDPTGFIHGCFSHRIQNYLFLRAIELKRVDLSLLKGYLDVHQPGVLFKYLLPPMTENTHFSFPIDPFCAQMRSHWQITLENDPFKSCNYLSFLPSEHAHFASPTIVQEQLLSTNAFKLMPYLAQAIYSATYSGLSHIANRLNEPLVDTFRKMKNNDLNGLKMQNALRGALSAFAGIKLYESPDYKTCHIKHKPNLKTPSLKHAETKFARGKTLFGDNKFKDAARKFEKAALEYERLGKPKDSATCYYERASSFERMNDSQAAHSIYSLVYSMRFRFLGSDHPDTQKAYGALDEMKNKLS